MSYSVHTTIYQLPQWCNNLTNFLTKLKIKNTFMLFLSEGCYTKLKSNSTYVNSKNAKAFVQETDVRNSFDYIEIINIVSSNCCLVKSISSRNFRYRYNVSIPREIVIIVTEEDEFDYTNKILTNVIEPDISESPVDFIINFPDFFDHSVVFLTQEAHNRLTKSTNELSYYSNIERLSWKNEGNYYGGDLTLHNLNCNKLSVITHMDFESLKKTFSFSKVPSKIYFIT